MGRHLEVIVVRQVKVVAKQFKPSPELVYNLCAQGKLAHDRLGVGRGMIRENAHAQVRPASSAQNVRRKAVEA